MESCNSDNSSLDEDKEYMPPKKDTESSSSNHSKSETVFRNNVFELSSEEYRNELRKKNLVKNTEKNSHIRYLCVI